MQAPPPPFPPSRKLAREPAPSRLRASPDSPATHVKRSIGFHVAKKIIVEADLEYPKETQGFLNDSNIEYGLHDCRFHDPLSDQHLTYNNSTGRRSWVLKYTHYEDGRQEEVLKEVEIDQEPASRDDLEEEDDDDDDDDDYY